MKLPEINPHSILTQGPSLPFSPLPPCLPASPQSIGPSWRLDGLPDRHSSLWDMVDSFHAERTQADLTSRRQDHMAYKACAWHAMANLPPILLLSSFLSPPLGITIMLPVNESGVAHIFRFRPFFVISIACGASFVITLWVFFLLETAGLGLSRRALSPSG